MSCVVAMWYAPQAQQASKQGKAMRLHGGYTQAVDGLVDNSISVDFVVDKFCEGVWEGTKRSRVLYP